MQDGSTAILTPQDHGRHRRGGRGKHPDHTLDGGRWEGRQKEGPACRLCKHSRRRGHLRDLGHRWRGRVRHLRRAVRA